MTSPDAVRERLAREDADYWRLARKHEACEERLAELQSERNEIDFKRGAFRVRGDVIDVFPAENSETAIRITLFDDELAVMVSPTHPFAQRESVEASELVDETYLTYSRIPVPGFEYERYLSLADSPPRVVISEAIELARSYSGEEAAKFVNGVLDGVFRKLKDEGLVAE